MINTFFQQHKWWVYTLTSPYEKYQNQIDYILCSWRWGNSIWSAKIIPGADSGSYDELLIARFRHKLKKSGKTTSPFRYDLYQITYHAVELVYRFTELDLIDGVLEDRQRFITLYRRQWPKPFPRKEMQKRQNGCLRKTYTNHWENKRSQNQKLKERFIQLNEELQRIARRDKKTLGKQYKEIEVKNRMRKVRDLFEKIKDIKGTFQAKWAQ